MGSQRDDKESAGGETWGELVRERGRDLTKSEGGSAQISRGRSTQRKEIQENWIPWKGQKNKGQSR